MVICGGHSHLMNKMIYKISTCIRKYPSKHGSNSFKLCAFQHFSSIKLTHVDKLFLFTLYNEEDSHNTNVNTLYTDPEHSFSCTVVNVGL